MNKELETLFLEGLEINQQRLFRICRVYSTNSEDAKDLFQEILIHVWGAMDAFKGKSSFSTWLFRIALNVCLQFKSKHIKSQSRLIKLDSISVENFGSDELTEAKESDEKLILLRTCIKSLNESDKALITLYLEELAYKEISEILGLTENNVAVKIRRVKLKLFNCLNEVI